MIDVFTRPECARCGLFRGCQSPGIEGRGSKPAKVVFVGEAPGYFEDQEGSVFVGESGALLDQVLELFEIDPAYVYVSNVIRCRPPQNRKPTASEIKACVPLLTDELADIAPAVIVPLGATALSIFGLKGSITELNGRVCKKDGFTIVPAYHPAAVLRSPHLQDDFENAFEVVARLLNGNSPKEVDPVRVRLAKSVDDVVDILTQVYARGFTAFDIETNFLKVFANRTDGDRHRIGTIAFSLGSHDAGVIPIDHPQSQWTADERDEVIHALRSVLEDTAVEKVAHNVKYELMALAEVLSIDVRGVEADTMLMHALLDENAPHHDLDTLSYRYTDLGGYKDDFKSVLPDPTNFLSAPLDILSDYNGVDAIATERLYRVFQQKVSDQNLGLVCDFNTDLASVIARMERNGREIDFDELSREDKAFLERIELLEEELRTHPAVAETEALLLARAAAKQKGKLQEEYADLLRRLEDEVEQNGETAAARRLAKSAAGRSDKIDALESDPAGFLKAEPLNFGSVDQLRVLLFDVLGLSETYVVTGAGEASTGKDALIQLSRQHALPALLRTLRRVKVNHANFIAPIPALANTTDRRLHGQFLQHRTRTGRLAATEPNETNRPRKGTCELLGVPSVKRMYVSRFPKGKLVAADYSQLELRLLAALSKDPVLFDAYTTGKDVHAITTVKVVSKAEEFTKEQRTIGKRVNFLTVYGGRGARLATVLAEDGVYISDEEGDEYVDAFFQTYPGVLGYMEQQHEEARRNGFVVAPDGRRRRLPQAQFGDRHEAAHAEREAGNFTIQYMAAKLTCVAMLRIDERLRKSERGTLLVCNVHDSLTLDAPADEAAWAAKLLRDEMVAAAHDPRWGPEGWWSGEIPIEVDVEIGDDWSDLENAFGDDA